MYKKGESTGSNKANRQLANGFWQAAGSLSHLQEELLFDPQTSGGLLLSVPEAEADNLVKALQAAGVDAAARVAEVRESERPMVTVG
jgi:selenide,water dikinase